jgi:hypothetical protein
MLATTSILFISAAFLYLTTHCICHSSRLCFDIKRGENISNTNQVNEINNEDTIQDNYKLMN